MPWCVHIRLGRQRIPKKQGCAYQTRQAKDFQEAGCAHQTRQGKDFQEAGGCGGAATAYHDECPSD